MASYCPNCGIGIKEGGRFCSRCGYDTETPGGGDNFIRNYQVHNNGPRPSARSERMGDVLNVIFWFGIIWVILSLLMSASSFFTYYSEGSQMLYFIFRIDGPLILIIGIMNLLSSIFATLCCININKLVKHQQACTYCLAGSSIAVIAGMFSYGIVGIVFYCLMKKEGHRFRTSDGYGGAGYGTGYQYNSQNPGLSSILMVIMALGFVWGIGSFEFLLSLFSTGNTLYGIYSDDVYASLFGTIMLLYFILGGIAVISGIFAVLCCVNIYKQQNHKLTCSYCLIGSICALVFIIPGIIGLIFYGELKKQGHLFRS